MLTIISNPKDYAENQDARQYDRRLRGPVDERRELSINPTTGLKNYIASEGMGIDTSAGLVRKLFGRSIELGRQYARNKNKKDLYEALRLLGTASHCLEDYAAHSNYVELALIELGERDVFPHVGRRTAIQLREVRHPVFPIVTGTFGGVDFLHSVCGEFDDKATQSEIEELDNTLQQYQNGNQDNSVLQDLLDKIPSGVFGGKDESGKANELKQNALNHQMQNTNISPRRPEEWARYLDDVQKQIYPIIEWHDEIMQSITETIEKIPILPDLIENVQEEVNKFVFTLLAPYVVPVINQVKTELNTGSNEIIQSSVSQQHIVFNDDNSSDPTHSMLSKDHFSNVLNEPAGKVARQIVKWVVPQIVACWDDESIDVERTLNRIIQGVLHHPALRDHGQDGASDGRRLMFGVVDEWWRGQSEREKNSLREQLNRRGVESGRNHKPGVKDHGHGNNRPLGMAKLNYNTNQSSIGGGIAGGALGAIGSALGGNNQESQRPPNVQRISDQAGKMAGQALGGGILGSLVGGIASQVSGDILGGGLGQDQETYKRESYNRQDNSRTETVTQVGHSQSGDRYGQAQYSRTYGESGEPRREEYNRFEQHETAPGGWQAEVLHEERSGDGRYHEETRYASPLPGPAKLTRACRRYGDGDADENSQRRRQEHHQGRRHDDDDDDNRRRHHRDEQPSSGGSYGGSGRHQETQGSGGYGRQERREEYGRRDNDDNNRFSGGERRRNDNDNNEYSSGYGRQQEGGFGSGGYGSRREEPQTDFQSRGGRREETSYGSGIGRREEESSSYGVGSGYGRRQEETSYRSRQEETYDVPGGFGNSQQNEYSSGGGRGDEYGGGQQSYGGGDEYGSRGEENEGYGGGRRRYGADEGEGEGYGGGYGSSRY
jgi:hypothetical protein